MSTIINRIDPTNIPVVFLLDSLDEKGNLQVWNPTTDEVVASTLDYYKKTKAVTDAQEVDLANKYVAKFGLGENFTIRRKLFRASKIASLHNVKQPETAPNPVKPPEHSVQVQTRQGTVIPAEEFVEKIIVALTKALRDTL